MKIRTLVDDFDVSSEAGFGGGSEPALVALEGLQLEMNGIEMSFHIGRVVRGVVAAAVRAMVAESKEKEKLNKNQYYLK